MNKQQNLKGQNNQCPSCSKLFKSDVAFSKHRTGPFGTPEHTNANRRCMSTEEMLVIGMGINNRGQWVTALYEGTGFWGAESDLEGTNEGEDVDCATEDI